MLNSADLLKTAKYGNVINYPCELLVCDAQGDVATIFNMRTYKELVEQVEELDSFNNLGDIFFKVISIIECNEDHILDDEIDLPF